MTLTQQLQQNWRGSPVSAKRQLYEHLRKKTTPVRPSPDFVKTYRRDPVAFRHDIVLTARDVPYQDEIMAALLTHKRVAVRSPHGAGKTCVSSWSLLWFLLSHPEECKIPTTASAWRQLTKFLWPEIHKWAKRLDWAKVGRPPFTQHELMTLFLRPGWGDREAFAIACSDSATIEGAHSARLLYIFDEAKSIPAATWDSAEGAFTSPTGEAYAMAISTPGPPIGRFYDIHSRKPGYEEWWVRHIKLEETIAAGMVSAKWAKEREKQWTGSDRWKYQQRVLGEFAQDQEEAIITLNLVEEAQDRWRDWVKAGRPTPVGKRVLGVDIARFGSDSSCIAERVGDVLVSLEKWGKTDLMSTTGKVKIRLRKDVAHVDVIGMGSGVVDRLRELGCRAEAINFGGGCTATDRSGEVEMLNVRAAAWWGMRELLEDGIPLLPPDTELTADLVSPNYFYSSSGKIQVERKTHIRKRLGRSPDVGDAVVMAFYEPEREPAPPPPASAQRDYDISEYRGRGSREVRRR